MGVIHIGTSGWNYKHWQGRFFPTTVAPEEMLAFYVKHFSTVEINNTFYQLPQFQTFTKWRQTAPADFVFAIKASRFITHMKKLKAPRASSKKLFNRVSRLEDHLGPILFQLPPGWHRNAERLSKFLEVLPPKRRYVVEFRDFSWLDQEIYDLLQKNRVAFCIHDFRGQKTPHKITANFTYVRMHGPRVAAYTGSYPPRVLKDWAQQIKDWREYLSDIYVYFNNDAEGYAIKNALKLKELCD